jgi:hypothetical protein
MDTATDTRPGPGQKFAEDIQGARGLFVIFPGEGAIPATVLAAKVTKRDGVYEMTIPCPKCGKGLLVKSSPSRRFVFSPDRTHMQCERFRCTNPGTFGQKECGYSGELVQPPGEKYTVTTPHGVVAIGAVWRT